MERLFYFDREFCWCVFEPGCEMREKKVFRSNSGRAARRE